MRKLAWFTIGGILVGGVLGGIFYRFRQPRVSANAVAFQVSHYADAYYSPIIDGILVTFGGQIWRFTGCATFEAIGHPICPTDLNQVNWLKGCASVNHVGQIDESTQKALLELVAPASKGDLVCATPWSIPASVSYKAWRFGDDGKYHGFLLSLYHSPECMNPLPEAHILVNWLRKYVATYREGFSRLDIGCSSLTMPQEDGYCDHSEIRVQAADGLRFCTLRGPNCMQDDSCACNGDAVCAGGRSHCRELEPAVLTCVR